MKKNLIYNGKKVTLYPNYYLHGMNLAIQLKIGRKEIDLTINLEGYVGKDRAFINTNSSDCTEDIRDWLIENKIATPTGEVKRSGFCEYAEFIFNSEILMEYSTKEYEEYLDSFSLESEGKVYIYPECSVCGKIVPILITHEQESKYMKYQQGGQILIQDIFPELDNKTRCLLARGQNMCEVCWSEQFGLEN